MKQDIKALIKLHILLLICFLISCFGIYTHSQEIGLIALSITTTIIPLSLITNIFISTLSNKDV